MAFYHYSFPRFFVKRLSFFLHDTVIKIKPASNTNGSLGGSFIRFELPGIHCISEAKIINVFNFNYYFIYFISIFSFLFLFSEFRKTLEKIVI